MLQNKNFLHLFLKPHFFQMHWEYIIKFYSLRSGEEITYVFDLHKYMDYDKIFY